MNFTYKFRAYPNHSQQKLIDNQLEICRKLYNRTLKLKIDEYQRIKKNLSLFQLHKELPKWKKQDSELNLVHSQVLQNIQERVDLAFQGFFRRLKQAKPDQKFGFPKEKEFGRLRSLLYPQSGFKILSNHTYLSKIGKIKTKFHRQMEDKIKYISLVKYPSGKYFICITVDHPIKQKSIQLEKAVGIDLGCSHFAVLSDGKVFDSPKPMKKSKEKLAKIQSKGKSAAILHERIANQRIDFLHKLANKLVLEYDLISVENLNTKQISSKKKSFSKDFRRAIFDNGWSIFINILTYKAVIAGKHVIKVDPAYTSQDCSKCGSRKKLELSERSYHCDICGLLIDRDLNAAHNILRLGIQSFSENL